MDSFTFSKFHGTGNDFVIIDNRGGEFDGTNSDLIRRICHRRFGIGADGLMLLENSERYAFSMRYYNSDGKESTMCGNGGRCIVAFAKREGIVSGDELFEFEAVDGLHQARFSGNIVMIKMLDVEGITKIEGGCFLNTGSPHYVVVTDKLENIDVYTKGKELRESGLFGEGGSNINFVSSKDDGELTVRTYERGVEDETWSCGTGCVAAVLSDYHLKGKTSDTRVGVKVIVKGGSLKVSFSPVGNGRFRDIWLEGAATFVFKGVTGNI